MKRKRNVGRQSGIATRLRSQQHIDQSSNVEAHSQTLQQNVQTHTESTHTNSSPTIEAAHPQILQQNMQTHTESTHTNSSPTIEAAHPQILQQNMQTHRESIHTNSSSNIEAAHPQILQQNVHTHTESPHVNSGPYIDHHRIESTHTNSSPNMSGGDSINDDHIDPPAQKKNTRGPTRMASVWNMPKGKKIKITLNKLDQPIKKSGKTLADFLGTLARNPNILPMNYIDWRRVPKHRKDDCWEIVQAKFDIPLRGRKWSMKSLGKKWRDYKSELKAAYFDGNDTTEVFNNPPEGTIRFQWEYLVQFWNSEAGKKRSTRNKRSRSMQKFAHTGGTKSLARRRDEMTENRTDNSEPSRAEVFIETHVHKDGTAVDASSGEAITRLNTLASQRAENPEEPIYHDEDFIQVMGADPNGHARTYGLGVNPSVLDSNGKSYSSETGAEGATGDDWKEKYVELEKKYAEMNVKMNFLMSVLPSHLQNGPDAVHSSSTPPTSSSQ